jgi:hypothetical protein
MGSSSKGSSSSAGSSYDYFGTILIGLGEGPIDALVSILEDGKEIYHGPLLRNGATDPSLITIPDRGKLRLAWGTTSQASNTLLAAFDVHPAYRDRAYICGEDFLFGRERSNCPNWEFVLRRAPRQTLITGTPAQLDSAAQANLVAFAAEVLTSATGLAQSPARLHQASWQAVAEALDTIDMRALFGCSPLLTSQVKVRSLFESWGEIAQIWARRRDDGLIELGRWTPPVDTSSVPLITAADLAEDLEYDTADMDNLPTEYTIEFTDGARLYKKSSERVPDLAAGRVSIEPASENLTHPEITRRDQARRIIAEYMRQRRGGSLSGTAQVRRSKAISIRPGDYFRLDIDTIPGGAGLAQLMRCLGRSFGPTGPIGLQFQSEPASAPVPFVGAGETQSAELAVIGPLYGQRLISLPPARGEDPSISCLAARPGDDVVGLEILYDDDPVNGTFGGIGFGAGWALPVKLAQAAGSGAATVRVNTFAEFTAGHRADRERWILETGSGASEAEARNDVLLLVLIKKDTDSGNILPSGDRHYMEVLSIAGISLVSTDTWDLSVLRGRLGTSALAFDAGSFPDAWSQYEGWVIPRSSLGEFSHGDFPSLMTSEETGYFRFRPYSRLANYDPSLAYEAGLQSTEDWDTAPFTWPTGYAALAGLYFDFRFKRAGSQPATPTGDNPSGWVDGPPQGTDPLWMSRALRSASDTLVGAWSQPVRMDGPGGSDGHFIDHVFKRAATQPLTPTGNGTPSGWFDAPPAANGNPLWMSVAEKTAADVLVGSWSPPVQLDGPPGSDAPVLQSQYSVDGSTSWHGTYSSNDLYMRTSADGGSTWSGAIRIKGEAGANGIDGHFIDHVFKRAASQPSTPTGNGTPSGWSDAPPAANGNPLWMSVAEKTAADVLVGSWATPIQMDGSPGTNAPLMLSQYSISGLSGWHSTYAVTDYYLRTSADGGLTWSDAIRIKGEDGTNGAAGHFIDHVFKRAASAPSTPTGNGTPSGWYDAPPATNGNPLWMSVAEKTATDILVGYWSAPVQMDGNPGAPGSNAPALQSQYSFDGSTSWHGTYSSSDLYMRTSADNGSTWSAAIRIKGESGSPGADGHFIDYVFKRAASQPSTPTGNGTPSGWYDAPPAANGNPLWVTNGEKTAADVLVGSWSAPVQLDGAPGANAPALQSQYSVDGSTGWHSTYAGTDYYLRTSADNGSTWSSGIRIRGEAGTPGTDGHFIDHVFKRAASQPSTPGGNGTPSGWYDAPPAADGTPLWMSVAEKTAADVLVGSWSSPVQMDGNAGSPGSNAPTLQSQYSVDGSTSWHGTYSSSDLYMRTSADNGSTWSAAIRIKGESGSPGADGHFIDYVFKRAASQPSAPTGNGTPSGWYDAPPVANGNPLWVTVGEKTAADVLVGSWSTPVQLDGTPGASAPALQSQYSVDGSTNWHGTYASNDLYMRTSSDAGATWSSAIRIKGEAGAGGDSISVEYSVDGSTNWHSTFTDGDYFMHQRIGSGSWSAAMRIIGEKGDPGGTPATDPDYSDDGHTPFRIGIHKPSGAGSGYHVDLSQGGGAWATAYSFPFTLTMSNASQTFQLVANDTGKSPGYMNTNSWNSLFL